MVTVRSDPCRLLLTSLVRGEGHGGGNESEKGDDLEGLHGADYNYNILRIKMV